MRGLEEIRHLSTRCGTVLLFGRPNAGKSTLLNACIGQKIAGISSKAQTTRNRIRGVETIGPNQLIFLDTPGIHRTRRNLMNRMMNRQAWNSLAEADVICYLIDLSFKDALSEDLSEQGRSVTLNEADHSALLDIFKRASGRPVLLLATKSDKIKKAVFKRRFADLQDVLAQMHEQWQLDKRTQELDFPLEQPWAHALSAKTPGDVHLFKETLIELLPEGPHLFAEDDLTDKPERFVVGELIRESVFRQLSQEIPYGTGVIVEHMGQEKPGQTGQAIMRVEACIVVARESHKPMVIGKAGARIKEIGRQARLNLERHFATKVFLDLTVLVKPDWIDDVQRLEEYQHLGADE